MQWRNPIMANERNPNDPGRSHLADDPYLTNSAADDLRRNTRFNDDLQMDPELAEGPASGGRIAAYAIVAAVVLGAVFFGLNHSTVDRPGAASTAQNTPSTPPQAPPGMRDVTPRANNMAPGQTTGAAPAQPQTPRSAAPTGPDMNRTANPPLDSGQSK
jgi:hypothetical protein